MGIEIRQERYLRWVKEWHANQDAIQNPSPDKLLSVVNQNNNLSPHSPRKALSKGFPVDRVEIYPRSIRKRLSKS